MIRRALILRDRNRLSVVQRFKGDLTAQIPDRAARGNDPVISLQNINRHESQLERPTARGRKLSFDPWIAMD